jgi:uncharacterized membrane protein
MARHYIEIRHLWKPAALAYTEISVHSDPSEMSEPFRGPAKPSRLLVCALGALASLSAVPTPAAADLRICNTTSSRIGVAVGYRDQQGWLTEGWFNLRPNGCEAVLKGDLTFRYYYVYGIDYDRGGEWSGASYMCTREREFTVRGFENCLARGFERTGFFEIDTGEQKNWTVQLSDSGRQGGKP